VARIKSTPAVNVLWPVVLGGACSLGFYTLISTGYFARNELLQRYFASHPVEYITTTLFAIGLAALLLKLVDTVRQAKVLDRFAFSTPPDGRHTAADCPRLLEQLDAAPVRSQRGWLLSRLREALVFVDRKANADALDEQVRHLSDVDADRAHDGYGLVRIIIWAVPILGFLGTVIGITLAVANLNPTVLEKSLPDVIKGLSVAFDTTALSLALSMVLMFTQFFVGRAETRLLERVDARVSAELTGRFEDLGGSDDGQLQIVRRMADHLVRATETLVERQARIWQTTIDAAHQQWSQLTTTAQGQIESALTAALANGLSEHNQAIAEQQRLLAEQGQMMLEVVKATGEVTKLESALNRNLGALSASNNFAEMVVSLSAAINLLSARLNPAGERTRFDLSQVRKSSGNAA